VDVVSSYLNGTPAPTENFLEISDKGEFLNYNSVIVTISGPQNEWKKYHCDQCENKVRSSHKNSPFYKKYIY
jgi:hypothetical protein